jgi:NAD(P)-dependent dehydrogenase (short-subunit alcohol dehydrogenase family)
MSSTVLITGANRGLGLEFARQYAAAGWQVIACCRIPQKADALQQLKQKYVDRLSIHALDVADFAQIEQLARQLKNNSIDVLINNAGVYQFGKESFGDIDYEAWLQSFRVNAMAPLKMAEAFISHVSGGEQKKIINITSKMGSIDDNRSGQHYPYRSSKAALNMVTKSLAIDLAPRGITAIVLHPGLVQTDMGGYSAPTTVEQSISGMREVIARIGSKDNGKFYDFRGQEILW